MMILLLLLTACGGESSRRAEQLAQDVRAEYLALENCQGTAELTADYGQRVYSYVLDFSWQKEGELVLALRSPEEVSGMTAHMADGESVLEYDGVRLETGALTGDGLSPLEALPALLRALREDFIAECGMVTGEDGGELLRLCCRDPEQSPGTGREIMLWLQPESRSLLRGEVAQDGVTVIQCVFTEFTAG